MEDENGNEIISYGDRHAHEIRGPMKVWLVGISDTESDSIICLCATKELAIKKLFEERDRLITEWRKSIEYWKSQSRSTKRDYEMYQRMVDALYDDDYENWSNYPHECPYIQEMEVLDQ